MIMKSIIVGFLWLTPANAFVGPHTVRCSATKLFLDRSDEDVESARRQLEFLVKDKAVEEEEPWPLLSSIGRERREAEIKMLKSLEYSDDATASLWALWYGERGPQASREIHEIEALFADPSDWDEAEERLEIMLEQHGTHFVEPINRLATLYYLQGKFVESKRMCEHVLEHKPWHIGALSGIVLVCANMNLLSEARHWAGRRLPPLPPVGTTNERREAWVLRAVGDAEAALVEEEKRLQKAFGKKQQYEPPPEDEEEDAWQ